MAVLAFAALALSIGYLVTSYQLNNLRSSRPRWIGGRQRDRRLLGHQSIGTNPNVFRKINLDATGSICQPLVRRGQTALRLCDQPPRSAQTAPAPVHLLTRSPSRLCASCRGSPIDHGAAPPLRHDRLRPPLPPPHKNLHLGRSASFWNPPEGGFLTRGSEGRRGRPDAYVELGADLADLRAMKANPRVFAVMLGGVRTPEQTGAESAEDLIA